MSSQPRTLIFKSGFRYQEDVFYTVDPGFLVSNYPVRFGEEIEFHEFDLPQSSIGTFRLLCNSVSNPSAFLIQPTVPKTRNLGTGLILSYSSWLENPTRIEPEDVYLSLKMDGLLAFSAVNKMTVITTPEFSGPLHDYLTMV